MPSKSLATIPPREQRWRPRGFVPVRRAVLEPEQTTQPAVPLPKLAHLPSERLAAARVLALLGDNSGR